MGDPAESTTPPEPAPNQRGRDLVGWLTSLAIHGVLFCWLALVALPELPIAQTLSLLSDPGQAERLDELFNLDDTAVDLVAESPTDNLEAALETSLEPESPDTLGGPALDLSNLLDVSAISASTEAGLGDLSGAGVAGRTAKGKAALVAAKGGSPASELAVSRGLKWLAEHQNPDGTWSLIHSAGACNGRCANPARVPGADDPFGASITSATGLALLPFLGAGETHERGRYRRTVRRGLEALTRLGEPKEDAPGLSWMDSGLLYAHGICAIALSEAYGMSDDSALRPIAQAALDFSSYAQDPSGGGWRYTPQTTGDTSVTGWHIMALKSGLLAGLNVAPRVPKRASRFLDMVQVDGGTRYRYVPPDDPEAEGGGTATLSAVGLLCRMYLGWNQSDPRLVRGVERLAKAGPRENNFYHNYYAAQAVFHQTGGVGPVWGQWNEKVRELLIEQQETRGHQRGSWWVEGPHNERGGRLYATALATMTLEVYYRYLPLYQADAVAAEFPD